MTESITIDYKPLIKGNIIHTKKLNITIEQLFGIMIMANAISSPDNIIIKLSNGSIADITQVTILPYIAGNPELFEYTANFGQQLVMFDGLELIQGAIQLCILFGIDPGSMITNIKRKNIPIQLDFSRYFGILSIPNFTNYKDGTVIDMEQLKQILSVTLVNSISKILIDCFGGGGVGVPCETYIITDDINRSNVIASASATLYPPNSVNKYKQLKPYYIFNVCANSQFRGQGLAKSIMITMLNDLINKGFNQFILEVIPNNLVAYSLYKSLGFIKLTTTTDSGKIYDLLYLKV
jgi:hypothetical protein